jgi:hypothetical protein
MKHFTRSEGGWKESGPSQACNCLLDKSLPFRYSPATTGSCLLYVRLVRLLPSNWNQVLTSRIYQFMEEQGGRRIMSAQLCITQALFKKNHTCFRMLSSGVSAVSFSCLPSNQTAASSLHMAYWQLITTLLIVTYGHLQLTAVAQASSHTLLHNHTHHKEWGEIPGQLQKDQLTVSLYSWKPPHPEGQVSLAVRLTQACGHLRKVQHVKMKWSFISLNTCTIVLLLTSSLSASFPFLFKLISHRKKGNEVTEFRPEQP